MYKQNSGRCKRTRDDTAASPRKQAGSTGSSSVRKHMSARDRELVRVFARASFPTHSRVSSYYYYYNGLAPRVYFFSSGRHGSRSSCKGLDATIIIIIIVERDGCTAFRNGHRLTDWPFFSAVLAPSHCSNLDRRAAEFNFFSIAI